MASILTLATGGAPGPGFELSVVTSAGLLFKGAVSQLTDDWVIFSKCTMSNIHNMDGWDRRDVVVNGDHVVAAWLVEPR